MATSSWFRQESQDFLWRHALQSQFPRKNATLDAKVDTDDWQADWDEQETSDNHFAGSNIEWTETDDLNLEALDLSVFSDPVVGERVAEPKSDVFHECSSIMLTQDGEDQEQYLL